MANFGDRARYWGAASSIGTRVRNSGSFNESDRDIADRLIISESTVKFHMNNVLKKLKAQTRYQPIHQAIINGSIQ